MRNLALLIIVALAAVAPTQDWAKKRLDASPRHQEWVELTSGSRKVKCLVIYPERKEKAPVIVMIHEIMGLTDWAMSAADQFAEQGYIVIAPDFVSGLGPNGGRTPDFGDVGKVREAISGLAPDRITSDLDAACDYAKKIPSASGKLAVAGFCWGGTQSFRFATHREDLSEAFVFYGTAPTAASDFAKVTCPVHGFYGGNDNRVGATLPSTRALMQAAKKRYEVQTYDGAGHGFMRAGEEPGAIAANVKARAAAWKRMLEILERM